MIRMEVLTNYIHTEELLRYYNKNHHNNKQHETCQIIYTSLNLKVSLN